MAIAAPLADPWRQRGERLPLFGQELLSQPLPAPPSAPGLAPTAEGDALAPAAPAAHLPAAAPGHRLRPGDQVRLVAWGGPDLNAALPISPEGQLAVPGFGAVPVAGLSRAEAQAAVTELLQVQFVEAGCVLAVERAAAHSVTVLGEVARPGTHTVPAEASVLEALRAAGGPLDRGSLRRVRVAGPDGQRHEVDLYPLLTGESLDDLAALDPGTVIAVPLAGPQVAVYGAVRRSYTFELRPGDDLAAAVALAGEPLPEADPARARLLREGPEGQELQVLAVAALTALAARDGDRLHLGIQADLDQRSAAVSVDGAVRAAGTYPMTADLTVGVLLAMAGGATPDADLERALVVRQLPQARQLHLTEDTTISVYEDLVTALTPDTALQSRDRLVVPQRPDLHDTTLSVHISGAVRAPGRFPLVPDMTAGDLLRLAGGITAEAQVDVADLVRISEAGTRRDVVRSAIDLRPILNREAEGPTLRNGDAVVVRKRSDARVRVTLEGEVTNVGEYVLPAGTTLGEALAITGGLTRWAFPEGARFFRVSEAEVAQRHLEMMMQDLGKAVAINERQLTQANDPQGREILQQTVIQQELELERMQRAQATGRMAGVDLLGILAEIDGADFVLQDGDRLVIPKRPGTIRVLGQVMTPGSLRFEPDLRVRSVIERAGGVSQQADEDRIFVVRANGSVVASAAYAGTAWDPDGRRWVRTNIKKIVLQEGDSVLVPPDLEYRISGVVLAKDLSQILFQVAATVGTIAVIGK